MEKAPPSNKKNTENIAHIFIQDKLLAGQWVIRLT